MISLETFRILPGSNCRDVFAGISPRGMHIFLRVLSNGKIS